MGLFELAKVVEMQSDVNSSWCNFNLFIWIRFKMQAVSISSGFFIVILVALEAVFSHHYELVLMVYFFMLLTFDHETHV